MTRRGLGLAVATLLVVTSGCGGGDSREGLKVYRHSENGSPTNIDPIQSDTIYANIITVNVYDTLYRYKYLARPYEIIPNLAVGMPEVSDDGLSYTIRIKEGVGFIDDEAFPEGVGREVVAGDFVYSIKRHFDPENISRGAWLWDGRIEGMDQWIEGGGDYDAPVSGLTAPDDYTIRIRLTQPFPQLTYTFAMGFSAFVPREAVEYHGTALGRRAVGSGPYRLTDFNTTRAVFEANEKYREEPLDLAYEGYDPDVHGHLGIEKLAGLAPPYVDRLEIDFIEETSSRWASFTSGREIQYATVPPEQVPSVLASRNPVTLNPEFADRYHMISTPETGLVFTVFNMDDPVIGVNDDPERNRMNRELRCSVRDAFSWQQRNDRFYAGLGVVFPGVIPPVVPEFDAGMDQDSVTQNGDRARRRLADAGWTDANLPELEYGSTANTINREMYEQFRGNLTNVGYPQEKISIRTFANFGDFSEAMHNKELMIMGYGWGMDYPDAENTLQLFYGPNGAPGSNASNYSDAEYDALYEQGAVMQPSPERTAIFRRMNQMLIDDCVGMMALSRQSVFVWHKDVIGQPDREVLGGFWLRFVDVPDVAGSTD